MYNWLLDFLLGYSHCTKYNGQVSALQDREIFACIIQCSAIGPAMHVVEAADLHNTYVISIIPVSNAHIRTIELEHIEAWSKANNLTINRVKFYFNER